MLVGASLRAAPFAGTELSQSAYRTSGITLPGGANGGVAGAMA